MSDEQTIASKPKANPAGWIAIAVILGVVIFGPGIYRSLTLHRAAPEEVAAADDAPPEFSSPLYMALREQYGAADRQRVDIAYIQSLAGQVHIEPETQGFAAIRPTEGRPPAYAGDVDGQPGDSTYTAMTDLCRHFRANAARQYSGDAAPVCDYMLTRDAAQRRREFDALLRNGAQLAALASVAEKVHVGVVGAPGVTPVPSYSPTPFASIDAPPDGMDQPDPADLASPSSRPGDKPIVGEPPKDVAVAPPAPPPMSDVERSIRSFQQAARALPATREFVRSRIGGGYWQETRWYTGPTDGEVNRQVIETINRMCRVGRKDLDDDRLCRLSDARLRRTLGTPDGAEAAAHLAREMAGIVR
jgi:hypothetical protein